MSTQHPTNHADRLDQHLGTLVAVRPAQSGARPSEVAEALALTSMLLPLPRRAELAYREHRRLGAWTNRRRQN